MKRLFFSMVILGVMIFSTAVTFAEDIYIPIDNRPINLIQTIEIAERLG